MLKNTYLYSTARKIVRNTRFYLLYRTALSQFCSLKVNYNLTKSKYNIVFIWIPKTAGTTIYNELNLKLGMQQKLTDLDFLSFPNRGPITFSHINYNDLLNLGIVSKEYHEKAFKFCIVRNPYTRAISLFKYLKKIKRIDNNLEFESFLDKVYLYRPSIGLYNSIGLSQTNPQSDWITSYDGSLLVNNFFKFEELSEFSSFISKKFNVEINFDKFYNKSHDNSQTTLSKILQNNSVTQKIEEIYSRDFELFGYEKYNN